MAFEGSEGVQCTGIQSSFAWYVSWTIRSISSGVASFRIWSVPIPGTKIFLVGLEHAEMERARAPIRGSRRVGCMRRWRGWFVGKSLIWAGLAFGSGFAREGEGGLRAEGSEVVVAVVWAAVVFWLVRWVVVVTV